MAIFRHWRWISVYIATNTRNFSTDLHWTEHYNTIIAKAFQILGLLHCTFNVNSILAKKQLYISLKCSAALNYGDLN